MDNERAAKEAATFSSCQKIVQHWKKSNEEISIHQKRQLIELREEKAKMQETIARIKQIVKNKSGGVRAQREKIKKIKNEIHKCRKESIDFNDDADAE